MSEATRQFVHAECQEWLDAQPESSIHCCVTDAPYGLSTVSKTGKRSKGGFMGKQWDYDVPSVEMWAALLRVLKPGGSLLCFAGTRTQHRMAVNIEDAGFRLVDTLMWIHGSGFPKAHDIGKQLDKLAGAEREVVGHDASAVARRNKKPTNTTQCCKSDPDSVGVITAPATDAAKQWDGWKSHALKPSYEPIILAMKPNEGSYAENALKHGVAGLNVEACRVPGEYKWRASPSTEFNHSSQSGGSFGDGPNPSGRYPPNLLHDGSDEVLAGFPGARSSGGGGHNTGERGGVGRWNAYTEQASGADGLTTPQYSDSGSAARFFPNLGWTEDELRFFYTAKANKNDRGDGNGHPTVKPVKLMRWLAKLVCPPGGTVLDPFMGSGTTAVACHVERLNFIGVEREAESVEIARNRVKQQCAQVMLEL